MQVPRQEPSRKPAGGHQEANRSDIKRSFWSQKKSKAICDRRPKKHEARFFLRFFRGGAWSCAPNMRFWWKSGPAVDKSFLFLKKRIF